MWRLKNNQPPFEVVDGPMAGSRFGHDIDYPVVPAGLECRFDRSDAGVGILAETTVEPTEPARTKGQRKDRDKEMTDA